MAGCESDDDETDRQGESFDDTTAPTHRLRRATRLPHDVKHVPLCQRAPPRQISLFSPPSHKIPAVVCARLPALRAAAAITLLPPPRGVKLPPRYVLHD